MAKTAQHNYAVKLRAAILNAAITGKLTGGTTGWKTVKLGEIADVQLGKMLDKAKNNGKEYRYLANISVRWGSFDLENLKTTFFTEREVEKFALKKGDILMCEGGEPGRCAIWKEKDPDIKYQKALHRIRLVGDLPEYVCIYFEAVHDSQLFVNRFTGSTIKHLPRERLIEMEIPLPPFAVQKEIVGKVEELMGLVEVVRKGGAKIRELGAKARAKILDLAIHGKLVAQDPADSPPSAPAATTTPPYPIPPNWKWVTLGEVCDYGKCSSIQASEIKDDLWSLDLEDIEKDTGKLLSKIRFGKRKAKGTRHIFKKGQLLYSKLRTYLNKVLVADEDGVCTTEILPLDFTEEVSPSYARLVLMSQMALDYTVNCGYGVKMPRLGTHDGKRMPFPLPPLAEQGRIVAKVEALLAAVETLTLRTIPPAEGVHH